MTIAIGASNKLGTNTLNQIGTPPSVTLVPTTAATNPIPMIGALLSAGPSIG